MRPSRWHCLTAVFDVSRPRLPKVINLIPAEESHYSFREGIRRVLQNEWLVVVLLFLTASTVRWLFHLQHPHANGFLIYQGAPLSDGSSYTYKAINIAEGHGIPPFQQPAVRPLYPITLACLYTWTGFSLQAIAALNIIGGGFSAALIYLCGVHALNRFCGLGAALFFAIDPTQLVQTAQAGTEPLGLLFFVASVYAILRAFESHRPAIFFLTGLFIGLSNLTRTLTVFTLPFYLGLILVMGWRERRLKGALIHIAMMVLGFVLVLVPWLIRQERSYGILSISDNIGESFYAATSPAYKQWTPSVRQDADADGIPNTIGDRYRYFMHRAGENVKQNPGFYLSNVRGAIWEYVNTFGPRSRALNRYAERYSSARRSQTVFLFFVLAFIISVWVLRDERPFARSSLTFLVVSLGLVLVYRSLPIWLTFVPILVGLIVSWRAARALPVLILMGSLAMAALGSVIFANTTMFRSILMTDWLLIFFFMAAVFFPAEFFSNRFSTVSEKIWSTRAGESEEESTPFQSALSLFSRRTTWLTLIVLFGFFAVSGTRLIALTISNPPKRGERSLGKVERDAILRRLQQPPLNVLPEDSHEFSVYSDWANPLGVQTGEYVVEVRRFNYVYYIPAAQLPPPGRPPVRQPYARTLAIVPPFDFTIPGEIPPDFSTQPLIFVGVVPSENRTGKPTPRLHVNGLAIIPFDSHQRPDFARTVRAPALVLPQVSPSRPGP